MSINNVDINLLDVDGQELMDLAESGELNDFIDHVLEDLSPQDRKDFMNELRDALDAAIDEYKQIEDGYDEKMNEAEDLQNGLDTRYKNKIEEVNQVIDFLKKEAEGLMQEEVDNYNLKHLYADDDMSVSTESYENGDHVQIDIKGKLDYFGEGPKDWDFQDIDGDGRVTYSDYTLAKDQDSANRFDYNTDIFISTISGDKVTSITESNGIVYMTVKNSNSGKTVTFEMNVPENGAEIFIDAVDESVADINLFKSLPENLQKIFNVGEQNVYDNLHEVSGDEELSYIKGYEKITDNLSSIVNEYGDGSSVVLDKTKEGIDALMRYFNHPDEATPGEIWSDFIRGLDGSDEQKSQIVTSIVMALALKGDLDMFQSLVGPAVATIENALISDDKEELTTVEKMLVMVMETYSGGVGKFGLFWDPATGVTGTEGATVVAGTVFGYEAASGDLYIVDKYFDDIASTQEALSLFQDVCAESPIFSDTTPAASFEQELNPRLEQETLGYSEVVTEDFLNAYMKALALVDKKDAKDTGGADGIDQNPYFDLVTNGILNAFAGLSIGTSMDVVATNILSWASDAGKNRDGDVLAGIIYYLNAIGSVGQDIVRSLVACDGFAEAALSMLESEDHPTDRVGPAMDLIQKYQNELAD